MQAMTRSSLCTPLVRALGAFALILPATAQADDTYHQLANAALVQDWSDTSLISADDDWSGVPALTGYRGDRSGTTQGLNPAELLDFGSSALQVLANRDNPDGLSTGGVAEFELDDPVIALQGSGTADAPFLLLQLDTRGVAGVELSYRLRDLDGSDDDAIQPIALQYRLGDTGGFTDLAPAFVADASTGPSVLGPDLLITLTLPTELAGQEALQLRWITANAAGSDEWIGVDDIRVAGLPLAAPVPEPASAALLTAGLGLLALRRRSR